MQTRQLQQVAQSCLAIAKCGDVIAQQLPWATIARLGPALGAEENEHKKKEITRLVGIYIKGTNRLGEL